MHTPLERLMAKLKVGSKGDCWPFLGACNKDGYGRFWTKELGSITAHRAMYALTHGGRNPRGVVMHGCDNPQCCNPDHLRLGTHAENVVDRVRKGRSANGENGAWRGGPTRCAAKPNREKRPAKANPEILWGRLGKRRLERMQFWAKNQHLLKAP